MSMIIIMLFSDELNSFETHSSQSLCKHFIPMKKIAFILAFSLTGFITLAQKVVALHSGTTVTMFNGTNPVVDAYNAAVNKDTIYIPGGFFNFPSVIAKRLVIIGAGHYPDSTQATSKTIINNAFFFNGGSDSSYMSGLEVSGNISFDYGASVHGVRIVRCKIPGIYLNGSPTFPKNSTIVYQCVFNTLDGGGNAPFSTVSNCIVASSVGNFIGNALIQNNIFLWEMGCGGCGPHNVSGVDNSLIQNNVFYGNHPWCINGNNNNVFNNLFAANPLQYTNTYTGNYMSVGQSNLVVSATPSAFSYSSNYNLQAPATYLGTDNTQVGLYGGTLGAYKAGAVPFNPHYYFKSVAPTTNASGQLNIQFKVSSQTN
jgi:hypothetical protein